MTRTIVRDLSSSDPALVDTFAVRLAEAIAALMVSSPSATNRFDLQPQSLEQLIAAAIHKELPQ
jgi:hypothetical protein